jgi:hypothetical protein
MKTKSMPVYAKSLFLVFVFLFAGLFVQAQKLQLAKKSQSVNRAIQKMNQDVLFDNGPFVTDSGGGPGGSNLSVLQDITLGMNYPGFGAGIIQNKRVSDDFVAQDYWRISNIEFFVYQDGSTTNSTIDLVNLRIWNGPPDVSGSEVVWGDDITNVISNTTWINSYRVFESLPAESNRPVMSVMAEVPDIVFAPGTYWIDAQFGGLLDSGPWVVPVTMIDSTTTGNALQSDNGVWTTMMDIGQQGIPFILYGEVEVCIPPINLTGQYIYHNGNDSGAEICWDGIEGLFAWLFYDDGVNYDGIGGPAHFTWAIKFDPEQLTGFEGSLLTKISIVARTAAANELRIYEGTNAETLLHTQTLSGLPIEEWSEVELTNSVAIDITKQLWIAVYTDDGDNYPAGCGDGMNEPNGDLITLDGLTWEHLSNYELDYTWNLRGYAITATGQLASLPMQAQKDNYNNDPKATLTISGSGSSGRAGLIETDADRAVTGYKIYRSWYDGDYHLLTSVPAYIGITHYCYYDDCWIGEYFYQVTAYSNNSTNECESEPGTALLNPDEDFVYVLVTDVASNEANVTRMYPNPANESVTIESSKMNRVIVMNTVGQVVYDVMANGANKVSLNTVDYEAGVYVVRIEAAEGTVTQRVTIVR